MEGAQKPAILQVAVQREEASVSRFASQCRFLIGLTAIFVALAAAITACGAPVSTPEETIEAPSGEEGGLTLTEALAVEPIDCRDEVMDLMGAPDAFTLIFQELEGVVVRSEEWSYFDYESRFDLVDGELVWTVDLEPVPDGSIYAQFYDPRDFDAYMSVAEVRELLGSRELEEIDLEEGDIPGGLLLIGDQILLGFDHDRLAYVETLILSPEEAP